MNRDWANNMYLNGRAQLEDHPNISRMRDRHRQTVSKTQGYRHPTHSNIAARNTMRPPTLLRLNSTGESESDYPNNTNSFNAKVRPPSQHKFLGTIFHELAQPLETNRLSHHGHLANTADRGFQGEIDLDRLVEKFSASCDMEHRESANSMLNQKLPSHRIHSRQANPVHRAMPARMTFNGGPYIICSSQDNTPRTFPAYYRFLNLAHFHPYSSATRFDQGNVQPYRQKSRHTWGGVAGMHGPISQYLHRNNKQTLFSGQTASPTLRKPFHCNETKPTVNDKMMQKNLRMSHQHRHANISSATKTTSSHDATETKMVSTVQCHGNQRNALQVDSTFFHGGPLLLNTTTKDTLQVCNTTSIKLQPSKPKCASVSSDILASGLSSLNIFADKNPLTCSEDGHSDKPTNHLSGTRSNSITTKDSDETAHSSVCSPCSSNPKHFINKQTLSACNNNALIAKHKEELDEVSVMPIKNHVALQELSQPIVAELDSTSSNQMHSSLAYLLGNSNDDSTDSFDSDFSDEDVVNDDMDNETLDLFESFYSNDPYNPLHGWKCLSKSTASSNADTRLTSSDAENENTRLSSTLNDSGIAVVKQASDVVSSSSDSDECNDDDVDSDSSDGWSDSGCDEEEQRVWDSFNRCDDPYDPMKGWLCNKPNVLHSTKESLPQVHAELVPNSNESTSWNLQPPVGGMLKSARHSSVSFILGDDSDSDSEDTNNSLNALEMSVQNENLWRQFETTDDPYDPINGWRCNQSLSSSLHKSASSTPSVRCHIKSELQHEYTPVTTPSTDASFALHQQTPGLGTTSPDVSLRCLLSAGCLRRTSQHDKKKKSKKVRFCKKGPTIIHLEVPMWADEVIQARRGHWQELARDRCRFQRRIHQTESIISPCLAFKHRLKVFQSLY